MLNSPEQQTPLNTERAWFGIIIGIIYFIIGFLVIWGNKERVPCLLYIYILGALITLVSGCAVFIAALVRIQPVKAALIESSLIMAAAALFVGYLCLIVGLRSREMRHRDC